MTRIVLHIDRLVLKGFRHEDRHAFAAGLQAELERLLADPDARAGLASMHDSSRLPVGTVFVQRGASPQSFGAATAQGIARRTRV